MQNFIKTIINLVQSWTKGEIKKSKADWNQNDASADNYVKNRPFYEENGIVHKLDTKYLPDDVAVQADIEELQNNISEELQNNISNVQSVADNALAIAETAQATAEIQADWEETSSTNAGYINNNPFTCEMSTYCTIGFNPSLINTYSRYSYDPDSKYYNYFLVYSTSKYLDKKLIDARNYYNAQISLKTREGVSNLTYCNNQCVQVHYTTYEKDRNVKYVDRIYIYAPEKWKQGLTTEQYADIIVKLNYANKSANYTIDFYFNYQNKYPYVSGITFFDFDGAPDYRIKHYTNDTLGIKYGAFLNAALNPTLTTEEPYSFAEGKYNISDSAYVHIVGNGTSDTDRSNAYTLDWKGNGWFANSVHANNALVLTDSTTNYEYIIRIQNGNLTSTCKASSLAVTTLPTKTTYTVGETLDLTDMIVTLTRQDGSTEEVNNYTYTEPDMSAAGTKEITVSYVEAGETYSAVFSVTVSEATSASETTTEEAAE